MGATVNSRTRKGKGRPGWAVLAAAIVWVQTGAAAEQAVLSRHAGEDFNAARARLQNHPADERAAWEFGSACFDYAEFATNDTQRATLAIQGIAAMRDLTAREPGLAAGHYYLAMNLGEMARTKMLGALEIVDEMEREFKIAQVDDERWDFAGPARNLGELYFRAPGWPVSIGSRHKAREWLEQAVKLAPDYPENRLNLVESYWQWKDREAAGNELKTLDALWPSAQTNFTGEAWERSWNDWSTRREVAREKLKETRRAEKTAEKRPLN